MATLIAFQALIATISDASAPTSSGEKCSATASEYSAVAAAAHRGLELQGLGEYATRAATHPPALVVGYGTPPDSGFATAVNLLCAVLG
ncbi:MAG TPA: hypothetical protein VNC85_10540 [Mycobacteriales bacterium]|nr:hypothetical protein [Mycobacteriales bacterium]